MIRVRGRLLYTGKRIDQFRIDADRRTGYRKILERAQRVDTVIRIGRNLPLAEQVVLHARGVRRHRCLLSRGIPAWSACRPVSCRAPDQLGTPAARGRSPASPSYSREMSLLV